MADCSCCGCTTVDNYRGQRQRPTSTTFAVWCNSNREFFDVESNTLQTFPTIVASQVDDGGGPWRLETGGGWVAGASYTPGGGTAQQTAQGGSLTIHGVYGSVYSAHVVNDGSAAIRAWGEEPTFTAGVSIDTLTVSAATRMSYNGQTIIKVGLGQGDPGEQPYALERYSSTGLVDDQAVAGVVTARTRRGASRNLVVTTEDQITHAFSVLPTHEAPPAGYENYFRGPVQLQAAKGSLYRNGNLVWEATRPAASAAEAYTATDGVYVWMSEVLEAADPPFAGVGIDDRVRVASPLKRKQSFVVDNSKPVFGFPPPNDFYEDQVDDVTGQRPYLVATKPIRDWLAADAAETDVTVRPAFVPRTGNAPNGNWFSEAANTFVINLPVGTHTVKPRVQRINTFAGLDALLDYAGNAATSTPTFTVTVHATPANNRRGARPLLEDVGLNTREYGRARLQSEKVTTVRLVFDRKVKADTVTAGQLTLTKDGVAVPGCTIAQRSPAEWLVTLPEAADQTPKSFWVLTYNPGGTVLTDDIDTIEHESLGKFPPTSRSVYRRVYVAKDTGLRYSKSPSGYVAIGSGPPRDSGGVDFEPEPCRLASRISWLMADDTPWLRPLDTSFTTSTIGDTMSITKTVASLPAMDGQFKITSSGGLIYNWGQTRQGLYADGFSPRMPGPTNPPADCSYWGLTTTVDPCEPALLRCPVAKVAQRHASILRRDNDLPSFRVSVVVRDLTTGADIVPAPAGSAPYWFGPITASNTADGQTLAQNVWFGQIPERLTADPGTGIMVGVVEGEVWLLALRQASEYLGLKSSMLWELEFDATIRVLVRSVDPGTGAAVEALDTTRSRIVLSKDDEDAWANDQTFYVRSQIPGAVLGYWWKFEPLP